MGAGPGLWVVSIKGRLVLLTMVHSSASRNAPNTGEQKKEKKIAGKQMGESMKADERGSDERVREGP